MANGFFDTKGLFGTTPEELQRELFDKSQQRRAQEMQFLAQGTTAPGFTYGMLQSLEPLRQQFANTGEDPRVTALREQEAAAKEALAGADVSTVEGQRDLLNRLTRVGLYDQAYKMGLIFKQQREGKQATPQKIKTVVDGKNVTAFVDPNTLEIVKSFDAPKGDLSVTMQRELNTTQEKAIKAEESVKSVSELISEIEASPWSGGIPAQVSEGIKGATGGRDLMSYIKMKVTELRTEKALGKLPPGSASDIDVDNAFKTVPNENSSSAYVLRWLKDLQRIDKRRAKFNTFKSAYISDKTNTSGMLKEWNRLQSEEQTQPTEATTTPVAPQAAPQAQPKPLMPTYEERGFSIREVR